MKVRIGEIIDTGKPLLLDVPAFIETRGLVVANSGGGKSYLLRVLAELLSRYVQCGIIARSDEFATIREKYDFILCGDEKSDSQVSYHTAQLKKDSAANKKHNERELQLEDDSIEAVRKMVRLLMTSKSHFVVDLSAITNAADRAGFAAAFLSACASLPRKLWHSVLMPIDEIHLLAPEEGKPVSKQPTIDIFSLTRKMGVCGVGATQRFSKLDKDAGAEANNVLVGRTVLDQDLGRAAKLLGFGPKRWNELKHLKPGEWFVFGPAFGSEAVMKVRIDEARTTHPRPGRPVRRRSLRKPSKAMLRAMRELVILPGKVVERRETVEALHAQISKLEGELKMAKGKIVATTVTREVEVKIKVPVLTKAQETLLKRVDANLVKLGKLIDSLKDGVDVTEKKLGEIGASVARITVTAGSTTSTGTQPTALPAGRVKREREEDPQLRRQRESSASRTDVLGGGTVEPALTELKDLIVARLAFFHPVSLTREQLAYVCDISRTTKSFISAMAELTASNDILQASGRSYLDERYGAGSWGNYATPSGRATVILDMARKAARYERDALLYLARNHADGTGVRREELASTHLNVSRTTKSFISAISALASARFVSTGGGQISLGKLLLEGTQ